MQRLFQIKAVNLGGIKVSMFPEHQISILEGFLKDQVTLKTGVISL